MLNGLVVFQKPLDDLHRRDAICLSVKIRHNAMAQDWTNDFPNVLDIRRMPTFKN